MVLNGRESLSEKALLYGEFAVKPALADVVLCGWCFEAMDHLEGTYPHHVVPDGCISLVYRTVGRLNPSLLIASGPRVQELRVEMHAGDRFWGIKFWPDAGGVILGIDPAELRERSDLLSVQAPAIATPLTASLDQCSDFHQSLTVFQNFVTSSLPLCPPLDNAVRQAVVAINRCDGVEAIVGIARAVGLSQRQLQRRFRARVGLTPKEYARIRRMRVALANSIVNSDKDWAAVAAEAGYADQAHFSRDAAALTGLTPVGFENRVRPIKHLHFDA